MKSTGMQDLKPCEACQNDDTAILPFLELEVHTFQNIEQPLIDLSGMPEGTSSTAAHPDYVPR